MNTDPVGGGVWADVSVKIMMLTITTRPIAAKTGSGRAVGFVVVKDDAEGFAGLLGLDVKDPVGGFEDGGVTHGEAEVEEAAGFVVGPGQALKVGVLEAVDGEGGPRMVLGQIEDLAEAVGNAVEGDVEVGARLS